MLFFYVFIFFLAEENEPKEGARCHEPFGFACASRLRADAPKLARLRFGYGGLKQSPRLYRPYPRCSAS